MECSIFLKLFSAYPLSSLVAFYTPSTKHAWEQVAHLSEHSSEGLAELAGVSLSWCSLHDRDQELNEELLPNTTFSLLFYVSSAGQMLHIYVSGTIGIHGPRDPSRKNLLSFVTDRRAYTSQHCALILM